MEDNELNDNKFRNIDGSRMLIDILRKRIKELEDENDRLRRILAELNYCPVRE